MTKIKQESFWAADNEERGPPSKLCKDRQSSKHRENSGMGNSTAYPQLQEQQAIPQHNMGDVKPVMTRSHARRAVPTLPSPRSPPPPAAAAAAAAGRADVDIAQDLATQPSSSPAQATPQVHQQQVGYAVAVTEHTPERPSLKRRQCSDATAGGAAAGGEGDDTSDGGEGTCKHLSLDRTLIAAAERDPRQHQQQQEEKEEEDQGSELLLLQQQQQPNMAGMITVSNSDSTSSGAAAHQQDYPGRRLVVQVVVGRGFVLNEKNIKSGLSISRSLVRLQFGQPKPAVPVALKVVVNDQPVALRVPQPQVKVGLYKGSKSINCLVFGGHHAGLLDYIGYRVDKWICSNAAELTIYLEGPVEFERTHAPAAAPAAPAAAAAEAEAGESVSTDRQLQQRQAADDTICQPAAAKRRRLSNSSNGRGVGNGGAPCTYVSSSLVLSEGNLRLGLCIGKALVEDQFPSVPVLVRLQVMLDGALIDLPHEPGVPPAVGIVKFQGNCYQVRRGHKLGLLQYIGHRLIGYSCTDGETLVMHLQTPSAAAEGTADLAAAAAAAAAGDDDSDDEDQPVTPSMDVAAAAATVDSSAWLVYGDAAAARAAEDAVAESAWWEHIHMHTRNGTILQQRHKSSLKISLKMFRNAFGSQDYAGRKMLMSVWQDGVRVGGPLPCKMHNSTCCVNPPTPLITQVLGCTLHKLRAAQPNFLQVHVSSPPDDQAAAADVDLDVVDPAIDPAIDGDVQQAAADSDCRSESDILPTVAAAAADADDMDAATGAEVQQPATGSDCKLEPNALAEATAAGAATSAPAAGIKLAAAAAPTSATQEAEAPVPPASAAEAAALAGRDLALCTDQQQRRRRPYAAAAPRAAAAAEQTSASRLTAEAAARLHRYMTSQLQQQQQERQDQVRNRSNGQAPGAVNSAAAPAAAVVVVGGESAAASGRTGTGIQGPPAAVAAAELADGGIYQRQHTPGAGAAAAAAGPAGSMTAQHVPAAVAPAAPADSCSLPVGYKLPDYVSISDAEDHLCDLLSVDNLHCPDEQMDRLQEAAATLMRLPAGREKLLRFRKDYRYVQEWVRRRNVAKVSAAVDKMLDSVLQETGS